MQRYPRLFGLAIAGLATTGIFTVIPAQAGGHASHSEASAHQHHTIVDAAMASASHSTLVAAVKAAGLVDPLAGPGPFTVFAPTDAAFAALPEGTIEAVLADADLLTAILTYHVAAGTAMSADLTDGMSVTTLNGEAVTVTINTEGIFINEAQVILEDIEADNGVVHVINGVLLPPTSVFEATVASWSLFPNPAQGWIAVEGWLPSMGDLEMLNAQGKEVQRWVRPDARIILDASAPGMYFIGNASMGWKRLVIR